MKIAVAVDSFKGSLTSLEAAEAIGSGVLTAYPDAEVDSLPLADGGEGTAETLCRALKGRMVEIKGVDALHRPITTAYGVVGKTAIIDVASTIGLTLIAPSDRDIMKADSAGVGLMIEDAYRGGCRRFIVGLGGSATCDAGRGMLSALGVRFGTGESGAIDCTAASRALTKCDFTILSDVTAALCGPLGAARLFASQKGATRAEIEQLEWSNKQFARQVARATSADRSKLPGAGAAGGLGFAFASFTRCRIVSGADAVLDLVDFERAIAGASLVITGEGSIDRQTCLGKLPMCVCKRAAGVGIPTIALAGKVADAADLLAAGFVDVRAVTPPGQPLAEAMRPEVASANLRSAAAGISV